MTILTDCFRQLLRMSVTAVPAIVLVLALRWLLRKAPKKISYVLWAVVGFRLLCPVTFSSAASIFNLKPMTSVADATVSNVAGTRLSAVQFGSDTGSEFAQMPVQISGLLGGAPSLSAGEIALQVCAVIWIIGMAAILVYSVSSYVQLRRKVSVGVRLRDNIYECDGIETPFVLGYVRPRICIPFHVEESEQTHLLVHEQTHLRRRDPWWKLLAFGVLTVYWWNPAVWLCYFLFCRDMEMSCDEAVLRKMGPEVKRAYSLSLVSFAAARRFPAANPLAFGEHDAKRRVKNILRWKQIAPGAAFLAIVLCVVVAITCCTNAWDRGSWIKDHEKNFSYQFSSQMQSTVVYQEVYERGTLTSKTVLMQGDFGSGMARRGSFSVTFAAQPDSDGGWESFAWTWTDHVGTEITMPSDLPEAAAKATAYATTYLSDYDGEKQEMEDGTSAILCAQTFDDGDGVSAYPTGGTADEQKYVLDNTAVTVLLRMIVSPSDAKTAAAGIDGTAEAKALYELATPYVGDVSADSALLQALNVQEALGEYKLELFTAKEPYILQVDLTEGIDSEEKERAEGRFNFLLLSLIGNLSEVRWRQPEGSDLSCTAEMATQLLQENGMSDIKTCGASVKNLSALMDWMKETPGLLAAGKK